MCPYHQNLRHPQNSQGHGSQHEKRLKHGKQGAKWKHGTQQQTGLQQQNGNIKVTPFLLHYCIQLYAKRYEIKRKKELFGSARLSCNFSGNKKPPDDPYIVREPRLPFRSCQNGGAFKRHTLCTMPFCPMFLFRNIKQYIYTIFPYKIQCFR
jgi:hypothetical protein